MEQQTTENSNIQNSSAPAILKTYALKMPSISAEILEKYSRENGITPPVLLRSALAALLYRYVGQDQISIGLTLPGYSGSVTVRIDLLGDPSYNELLQRGYSLENQSSSPRMLLESTHDLHIPVRFIVPAALMRPLTQTPALSQGSLAEPGIALSFIARENSVSGVFDYDARLYDERFIARMAAHLGNILKEALSNPAMPISRLEMLDGNERREILDEWNDTYIGYQDKCVHELFEERANQTPDAPAIYYKDRTITYAELNRRANQLAHFLRRKGIGPEILVGIIMERSIEAAIALLGILKAGGAYVAIDAGYPLPRIQEIISQANLALIIADSEWKSRLGSLEMIDLNKASRDIQEEDASNISSGVTLDNAAYVTFTSGSTGKPKGVIGIHRSIVNGLTHAYFERDQKDEVSWLPFSLSFGASIAPLFLPPCWGIPVVIIPEGLEKDPLYLAKAIERHQITSISMVATLFRQLLSLGPQASDYLRGIRIVALSGAAVTPDLIEAFKKTLPNAKLMVSYSASEIGGVASANTMPASELSEQVLIGKAAPNTRLYILDRSMNPLPPRCPGELYVSAAHLSRGYIGQPELTAERFLQNPFLSGEHIYRTGDRARRHTDGGIEILGRSDNSVKIRGFQVAFSEIEAALGKYPGLQQAAVTAYEHNNEQRLVAYLVMADGLSASVTDIRRFLQQQIPDYMIPSSFMFVKSLPINANGKLDRDALPPPEKSRPELNSAFEEPRNSLETYLTEIWMNVLGLDQIGVNDDFLEIGGDSLTAAQVSSSIRKLFNVEIPLPMFFEWMTITDLAAEISRQLSAKTK